MLIIPAIDVREGRCVRLTKGDFSNQVVYDDDPAVVARRFAEAGATWIHFVDLDGAREGAPRNLEALRRVLDSVGVPIQFGGGIRSEDSAERVLKLGVERVVVGTSLAEDQMTARRLFERLKERVLAAIDARGGIVSVSGWQSRSRYDAVRLSRIAESLGARRLIVTDIERDGTLAGPGIPLLRSILAEVEVPLIASGGVASLEDIHALRQLEPLGLEGAIVGKALYERKFSLRDAQTVADGDAANVPDANGV